jgi:hypothetical protein
VEVEASFERAQVDFQHKSDLAQNTDIRPHRPKD